MVFSFDHRSLSLLLCIVIGALDLLCLKMLYIPVFYVSNQQDDSNIKLDSNYCNNRSIKWLALGDRLKRSGRAGSHSLPVGCEREVEVDGFGDGSLTFRMMPRLSSGANSFFRRGRRGSTAGRKPRIATGMVLLTSWE